MKPPFLFRIRTVTAFLFLQASDFPTTTTSTSNEYDSMLDQKLARVKENLKAVETELTQAGYEVQTLRIATNPFGQWLLERDHDGTNGEETIVSDKAMKVARERLIHLELLLQKYDISFCAVGPALTPKEMQLCPIIVGLSNVISCSANVAACDVAAAQTAAQCILDISKIQNGLGNFRFCVAAATNGPHIPFFPAAKAAADNGSSQYQGFALGLENGALALDLLQKTKSVAHIPTFFRVELAEELLPVQELCQRVSHRLQWKYLGMDTSLNPSLEEGGSVAEAIESLEEIDILGGPGSVAAAAAITTALQSLPNIQRTGYCGLMLPVCEDQRLAALAATSSPRRLQLSELLTISSVCGVGIDTVPLAGNLSIHKLTSLILDMTGLAARWNKPLSCRVLPFADKNVNDVTDFDSPYMVNTHVFEL